MACGSDASTNNPEGSDAGTDAGNEPLVDASKTPELGGACAGGCGGTNVCTVESTECETGACLFDSRGATWQSYCTMGCSSAACPVGYHCEDVAFILQRACVADPAVCGDNVLQRGEACDDGNNIDNDGCKGDCSAQDTPAAAQKRGHFVFSVTGSYTPKGGADTPFAYNADVDNQLNEFGDECNVVRDASAGSDGTTSWRRFSANDCVDSAVPILSISVPFTVGTFSEPYAQVPRICAKLSLPAPDDAQVTYCAGDAQSLQVTASSATKTTGTFTAHALRVMDESIGGCDGMYAPNSCPDKLPDFIDIEGSLELLNISN